MGSVALPLHERLDLAANIPTRQIAAVKKGSGETASVVLTEIDVPKPSSGELLVKINW